MKVFLFLLLLVSTVFAGGDTYPLTSNIAFHDEVKSSFGFSLRVNEVNPIQAQIDVAVANYLIAVVGSHTSTHDAAAYGPEDTHTGTETQFYGAYLGYVPGEFRIQAFDRLFITYQYAAFGLGWQHTSQLYTAQRQSAAETYAVKPQERWDACAKWQLGSIFSYKHLGLLVAVDNSADVFVGIQFKLD